MKAEQSKHAKQQNTPNNEAAEQQDGPIYGPPTEKEHWQAISKACGRKEAEVKSKHKDDEAKLPAKPDYWPLFESWLKKHHPAVMDGYAAIANENKILLAEERKLYRKLQMGPLLQVWATDDPIGIKANEQNRQWQIAKQALDEQRDQALRANEKTWSEAADHLNAIEEKERRIKREAAFEKRLREQQEAKVEELRDQIGLELCRELNVDHPDFDKEAFEKFINAPGFLDDTDICLNCLVFGPTGGGKSRTMAYHALQIVEWADVAWITNAYFADVCSAIGKPGRANEAHAELRRLAEVEFLFFDDVGSVKFNETRLSRFYALLNERYKNNSVTFFSTNYNRSGLLRVFMPEGDAADQEIAERIVRRMIGTPAEPRANLIEFKRRKAPSAKGRREKAVC